MTPPISLPGILWTVMAVNNLSMGSYASVRE
jgi:hypothetical protein